MTLFARNPILLCILLFLPVPFVPLLATKRDDPPPLSPIGISRPPWPAGPAEDGAPLDKNKECRKIMPLPALTIYRSHMLLMTFFAILAVDFPVFPRTLAKCETFGVSLVRPQPFPCAPIVEMDLSGVVTDEVRYGRFRWILALARSCSPKASSLQYPS